MQIHVAVAHLRVVERHHPTWGDGYCAFCEQAVDAGHRVDCQVARALAALDCGVLIAGQRRNDPAPNDAMAITVR